MPNDRSPLDGLGPAVPEDVKERMEYLNRINGNPYWQHAAWGKRGEMPQDDFYATSPGKLMNSDPQQAAGMHPSLVLDFLRQYSKDPRILALAEKDPGMALRMWQNAEGKVY
jgi:hypothetical protein